MSPKNGGIVIVDVVVYCTLQTTPCTLLTAHSTLHTVLTLHIAHFTLTDSTYKTIHVKQCTHVVLQTLPSLVLHTLAFPTQESLAFLQSPDLPGLSQAVSQLSLLDVQYALFQCHQEGEEGGLGAYSLPGWGALHYCGLAGALPLLASMRPANDLAHPLARNLREGPWLADYTSSRLARRPATAPLAAWLKDSFQHLAVLPAFLAPSYFDSLLQLVWAAVRGRAVGLMSQFVGQGADLVQR